MDKLDELKLGRFKFSKNVCLDEVVTEGAETKFSGPPTFSGKTYRKIQLLISVKVVVVISTSRLKLYLRRSPLKLILAGELHVSFGT